MIGIHRHTRDNHGKGRPAARKKRVVEEFPFRLKTKGWGGATLINLSQPAVSISPDIPGFCAIADSVEKVKGVTGIILAGGISSRMGSNKALLPQKGVRLIEGIYQILAELFDEVIIVTNTPEQYSFLPCRKVPDLYPGKGVLAGIHSGLKHSKESAIFAVACDMPYLNTELIRYQASLAAGADLVIPSTKAGFEPLHAIYRKECLPALVEILQRDGNSRVIALFSRVQVREVLPDEVALFDPEFDSFVNINTPDDYLRYTNGKGSAEGDVKIVKLSEKN